MKTNTSEAEPASVPSTCPRCTKPLTDPAGMGWCQSCGFCRSLEEDKAKIHLEAAPAKPLDMLAPTGPAEQGSGLGLVWLWLLLGVIGLGAVSQVPARCLAPNSFERAVWTTGQIGLGILLILAGQLIALVQLAPHDEKLSFKDMFVPFNLWGQVLKRLPALRVPLWLGGWGLVMSLSAGIFIGGLSHWMTYLPGQKNHPSNQAKKSMR
jgi:hypothetical protein